MKSKNRIMKNIGSFILFVGIIFMVSCQSKPTVIQSQQKINTSPLENVGQNAPQTGHTVVVNEVLQASKYTYANVSENGEDFWIALPGGEYEVGATYQYVDGLKKTNFESRDFNRTFETIYLVGGMTRTGAKNNNSAIEQAFAGIETSAPASQIQPTEGSVALSDLFTNKSKYSGQKIQVHGKCVKVNNQIMGRNWVHIQDGTKNNEVNYDLTITTDELIQVGTTLTMEGTIVLNKDFGAGYKYDVLMENAVRK
jgi:hypothetical protein